MATLDIKLQNVCDHVVAGELLYLGDDRRTLRPELPVASESSLHLLRGGISLSPADYSVAYEVRNALGERYAVIRLFSYELTTDAVFEACYVTIPNYCPKCMGSMYTDDFVLDGAGDPVTVSDTALLAQMVEKAVVTKATSNKYHTWFGSRLDKIIEGAKVLDNAQLLLDVKAAIGDSLRNLQEMQLSHMGVNPEVSTHEVLGVVRSIEAQFDEDDPTIVVANVSYESRSGKVINFSQELELSSLRGR